MAADVQIKNTPLQNTKAPNLPISPVEYSQQYQDQFSNALTKYFTQIDNFSQGIVSDTGGKFLHYPYISAGYEDVSSSGWSQYLTAADTPQIVKWNTLFYGSGFTLNVDNTATAEYSGIYKITYSIQFANSDNTREIDVPVWLQVNGADVAGTATVFTIPKAKSGSSPSYLCAYSEVVFELASGDKVGLWWGSTYPAAAPPGVTKGIYMFGLTAQTTPMIYPSAPAILGSITFISAPPTALYT